MFKNKQSSSPSNVAFGTSTFFWAQPAVRSIFPFNKPDHGFFGTGFYDEK